MRACSSRDAAHGVIVNNRIRILDLLAFPGFPDSQAVLHYLSESGGGHFILLYDIRGAHRLIPVREED